MRTAICAKCRRLLRRDQDEEPRSLPPPLQRAQNKVLAKLLTNDAFRRRIKSSSSLFKHSLVSPPNVSFEEAKNPIVPGDQRSGRKHSTKRKQRNRDSKTGAGDENKQHGNRQTMSGDTHHHLSSGIAKNDFAIGNSDANDDIEKGRVFEESDSGDKSTSSVLRSDEDDSSKDYDWELWENCPLLLAVNEYNRVIPDEIEEKCKDLLSSKSKVSSSRKLPGTGRSAENPRCARVTKKSKLNNLKAPLSKVCPIIGEHSLDPAVPNIDLDKKYADVRKNISEETVSSRKIPDESLMLEISNKQDKNDDSHLLLSITKQEPKENVTSALLPNFIRNNIDGNEDLDAFVKKLVQNFKQSKNDPLSKINITEDLLKDEALMEKLNLLGDAKVQLLIRNIDDVREEDDRKRKTHSDEHVTNVNKEDAPRASEVTLENPRNLRTKRSTSNFDEFGYVEDENSAENHDFSNELELLQDGIRGNVVQGTDARREFIRNSENEMISLEQPKVELPTPNVSGLLQKLKQQNQQEVSRNGNRFSSSYSVEKDKAAQVTSLLKNILRKTQETDIPDRNLDTRAINLERLKKYVEDDGQVASRAHEKNIKKGKIENVTSETSTTLYVTEKATDTTAKDALLKKQLCKDKEFAKINPQLCGDNNKHAEKPHASKLEMPSLLKDFGEGIKTMVTDETRLAKDKIVPELKKTLEEIKDIPRSTLGKIIPQVEKNLKELRSNVRTRTEDLSLDELLPKFKSGISDFLEDEKDLITNKFTEAKEAATDLAKRGQDTFIGKVLDNLKPLKEANPHENIERLLKKANINLEKNSSDDARETVLEQTKTMQEIMNNPELVQNILKELQKPVNGENILGAKNEAEAESFIESNLRAGQSIEELLGASKNEENVSSVLSKTQKMGGHLNQSRNQHEVTNRTNQRVEQTIRSENVLKETQRGPKGDRIKQRLLEVLHNNSLFKISNETISELRDEILHAINEPFIRYELCHKYRGLDESPNLDDEHIVTQPEETIKMPENEPGDDATSGTNIVREKSPPDTDEDSPLIDAPKDETPKKNKLKMFKKKTPKKSPDLTEEDDGSGSQKALGGGRKELALPVDENEESIKTTTEDNVANPIIFQPSELVDETSENPEVGEPKNEETENKEKTKIAEKAPDTKLTSGSQNEDLPEGPELGLEEKTSGKTKKPPRDETFIFWSFFYRYHRRKRFLQSFDPFCG